MITPTRMAAVVNPKKQTGLQLLLTVTPYITAIDEGSGLVVASATRLLSKHTTVEACCKRRNRHPASHDRRLVHNLRAMEVTTDAEVKS